MLGHGTARASRRERDGQPHRRDVARSVSLLGRRAERALWSGLRKKCAFTRAFGLNWHAQTFRVRASLPNPDTTVPCPAGLEEPWRAFRFAGPAACLHGPRDETLRCEGKGSASLTRRCNAFTASLQTPRWSARQPAGSHGTSRRFVQEATRRAERDGACSKDDDGFRRRRGRLLHGSGSAPSRCG